MQSGKKSKFIAADVCREFLFLLFELKQFNYVTVFVMLHKATSLFVIRWVGCSLKQATLMALCVSPGCPD